jgi:hypothetical protein
VEWQRTRAAALRADNRPDDAYEADLAADQAEARIAELEELERRRHHDGPCQANDYGFCRWCGRGMTTW